MNESDIIFDDFNAQITCEEVYENEDLYGSSRVADEEFQEE